MRRETGRVEAFSDGVFAIAITLLVLDLRTPNAPSNARLAGALVSQWPQYLGFLTSFATIGIMWINHHRLFTLIGRVDHTLLILNTLLLLGITFVPYPTGLMAAYISVPGEQTAVFVYTGTFTVIAVVFNLLWRHASRGRRLLDSEADHEAVDAITRQYRWGPVYYLASFLMAIFSPTVAVLFTLGLAVYFALPGPSGTS
jgi:uncharacterized membrane protein